MLQHPVQACSFLYYFVIQLILTALHHILRPAYPRYQSIRIEVQKADLTATSLHFPAFTHRLPATYSARQAPPITGQGWKGYSVSGDAPRLPTEAIDSDSVTII